MGKNVTCVLCNHKFGCRQIYEHYDQCVIDKCISDNRSGYLVRFFSNGLSKEPYFIYAIVGAKCTFEDVDQFLRNVWCECCEHLSEFTDSSQKTISETDLLNKYNVKDQIKYEYDMGSMTTIYLIILHKFDDNGEDIEVVLRNDPRIFICSQCKKNDATFFDEETEPICDHCVGDNDSGELLKIVNSPRTGICGYS